MSILSIVASWKDTWHEHCIYNHLSLKLSGTNSETQNTSTAFTVTHWKWNSVCWAEYLHLCAGKTSTQALHLLLWLIESETNSIAINSVECLHIAACWRDTQHKHCGIYCDSLKVVFVIAIEWSVCTYYNCHMLERHATQALHLLRDHLRPTTDDHFQINL